MPHALPTDILKCREGKNAGGHKYVLFFPPTTISKMELQGGYPVPPADLQL